MSPIIQRLLSLLRRILLGPEEEAMGVLTVKVRKLPPSNRRG